MEVEERKKRGEWAQKQGMDEEVAAAKARVSLSVTNL